MHLTRLCLGPLPGLFSLKDGLLFRSTYSEEEKLQEVRLVSPDLLMSLPKGQAFVYSQGRMPLKIRLPLIAGEPEGRFTRRLGIGT